MTKEGSGLRSISEEELTTYAGRWVAIEGGQVIAVGDTAQAAERLGRRTFDREGLQVEFVEAPGGAPVQQSLLMNRLRGVFRDHDRPVYLVGGTVRDILLGRSFKDIDFAVPDKAIGLAFMVADQLKVPAFVLDQERDTGRVLLAKEAMTLDFAGFRAEDIEADLLARDFTINSMALPVAAETDSSLIDPCHGRNDLSHKLIRQTYDHSIADDPVRAMRALRLALQLDFSVEPSTLAAIRHAGPLLDDVSCERLRDELLQMLAGDSPDQALLSLHDNDLLAYTLPEVADLEGVEQTAPHREDVFRHTISVLAALRLVESALLDENGKSGQIGTSIVDALGEYRVQLREHFIRYVQGGLSGRQVSRLGAMFHDLGKSESQSRDSDGRIRFLGHEDIGARLSSDRLRKLHCSKEVVDYVSTIVKGHMWPLHLAVSGAVSRRAAYRFFKRSGAAGLDIVLLSLADHLATYGGPGDQEQWNNLLKITERLCDHYYNHYDQTIKPTPFLNGSELIDAFELQPGPEVGRLLRVIEEAQAAGEVSSVEEAKDLVAKELNS